MLRFRKFGFGFVIFLVFFITGFYNPLQAQDGPFGLHMTPCVSAQPGEVFCVPVKVINFDSIIAMLFSFNWEPDKLEFEAVLFRDLVGVNAIDKNTDCSMVLPWGPPHCGQMEPGFLTHLWQSPNPQSGTSVPDSTVIFEVCFRVKDSVSPGETSIININRFGGASNLQNIEVLRSINNTDLEEITDLEISGSKVTVIPPPNSFFSVNTLKECSSDAGSNNGEISFVLFGGDEPYRVDNV